MQLSGIKLKLKALISTKHRNRFILVPEELVEILWSEEFPAERPYLILYQKVPEKKKNMPTFLSRSL